MTTPMVVMPTSSFPRYRHDYTGHFVASLAIEISRTYPVTIIAPDCHEYDDSWLPEQVTVHRFHWIGSHSASSIAYGSGILENLRVNPFRVLQIPGFLAGLKNALQQCLSTHDVGCCISHWLIPATLVSASVIPATIPHIGIVHGSDLTLLMRFPKWIRCWLTSRNSSSLSHLVTVTHAQQSNLHQCFFENQLPPMSVQPMGPMSSTPQVNTNSSTSNHSSTSLPTTPEPLNILFMGRLIHLKGLDLLITALADFPHQFTLHVAGDGPAMKILTQQATTLKVKVQFHGIVTGESKAELLRNADMAVIPSRSDPNRGEDAMPTVFLEYLTAGVPVIATRVGGLPELGTHGSNCILVDANSAETIRKGLLQLLDFKYRQTLIAGGFETSRACSWQHIGQVFTGLIENYSQPNTAKS